VKSKKACLQQAGKSKKDIRASILVVARIVLNKTNLDQTLL